jgi:hypothetical protein
VAIGGNGPVCTVFCTNIRFFAPVVFFFAEAVWILPQFCLYEKERQKNARKESERSDQAAACASPQRI